jgi:hypothetical protein
MNDILGGSQVLGLLSPELQAQAEQRARSAGLTNLGFALLQASQGQPGQRRPGLGQIIGQAGPVGLQAYQQSFDRTLQDMLRAQQIQDMQKQRAQREQQELARQRFAQQFAPTTAQTALSGAGRVGPTAERAAMIGQTPALDRSQLLSAILDPNMPPDVFERAKAVYEATAPAKVTTPTSVLEYERSKTDPGFASFLAQKQAATGTKISIDMNKTLGGTLDKNLESFFDNGAKARGVLPTVQTMSALLDEGVQTGFGQETINKFNQAAQLFDPNYKAKGVAGQEAFIALSNEIILPQVKQLGVNPTDADLNFIIKGSPTLSKSVEGNRLLLNALNIKLQRDAFLQEFVTNWQDQNVSLIEQSPVRANTELRKQVLNLTKTHPLWTESTQQLRQQYSQILGGQPASLTRGSPFRK